MRKLLSVLFSTFQGGVRGGLLLLLLVASAINIYASDIKVGGIWYDFDSSTKTASVTYRGSEYNSYSNEYSGSVIIPETITYNGTTYSVTSIGEYAFSSCRSLTSITIPESVRSIGDCAFEGCSSLTSVTIPNSVTSIGDYAFLGCSSLTSMTIPESVTSIGEYAFSSCRSLTSITIPESVRSIGDCAFEGCSSLTSVTIPNSVTSIGSYAFRYCSSLTSVTIPNSVTSIGNNAFLGCSALTSVTIPNSVTSIGYAAFNGCFKLTKTNYTGDIAGWCNIKFSDYYANPICYSHNFYINDQEIKDLVIPESVTSIGNWAFYECSSLTSVTIPNSVTSIGEEAFSSCSKLTSVTIPNSVTSIGSSAFYGCSSLTSVTINSDAIVSEDYEYNSNISHKFGSQVTEYIIGESVTSIGHYAFSGCSSLTSVTIPNSVTSIGSGAFYECSSLTSVTIPNSVTSIGSSAFYNCSSLTSVTIGESVKSIGNYAFSDCSSLTSVTIPNSVTSIGSSAFDGCSSLTSVTINSDAIVNKAYSSNSNISHIFGSQITEYIIGESVKNIGSYAFSGCSSLTSVTINSDAIVSKDYSYDSNISHIFGSKVTEYIIGESVTSIGSSAFAGCSSLTSVTIPNSVTSIGNSAFYGCSSLTSVTIPNSVTSIGSSAFDGCSSLTSVTIPNSVTSIRSSVFCDCSSLTSVNIPNSVTSIGDHAFNSCSSLTSVNIPNSVTSIGEYAFEGCSSLTSMTIPNSVTSIGNYAFSGCSSLTSVTIGESVTSIGDYAFASCSSLPVENNLRYADTYLVEAVNKTLSTYSIKEGTKWVGMSAFSGCSSLTSVTIPNSVISIGDDAFWGCSSLTSVTIGDGVTSIGDYAFYYCSSLTSVTIPNSVTSIGSSAFYGCSSLTSVTINSDAIVSEDYEYNSNISHKFGSQVTEYIIGESVTSIGDYAFYKCSSLTSVTIPNSVTNIEAGAFYGCSSLTSVTIPNSVTSIGNSAFNGCSSLTSVTIPNSVTSIGSSAFYGCSSLTSVTINSDAIVSKNYSYDDNISDIFGSQVTEYIIGDDVKGIGGSAFDGCSSLTSVTIPNSVTSIGNYAFRDCSKLTSVTIPNSVTSIGAAAFSYCSKLTSVTIGESMTSIGGAAFRDCSSLTSITCKAATPPTIGNTYTFYDISTSIPVYVPCGCIEAYKAAIGWEDFTNIQELLAEYSIEVNVNDTIMGSAKVDYNTFCEGAQISATPNIGYHFVQWSDGVTDNPRTLELTQDTTFSAEFAQSFSGQCGDNLYWSYNETVKTISITGSGEMYDYTATTQPWLLFKEQIVEVTTTNTVTSIGTSAFEGCIRLSKISLGTGLEEIAANAFAGCTRLYDIYVYATYPPFAEESSFANYNVYVYIPCEYQRDYILDVVWGEFKFIECIESEDVTTDGVLITPSTNDVTITWPTEGNADTYTIVIKKGDTVFCTLTFNADGQLLNIAFAPGRNGNHPVQYAEQAGNGYRFTVTGLESGTKYGYNIDVKDASNKTIKSHSGEFTTQTATSVENTNSPSPTIDCQKIIHNGQLLILRDGVEYTIMGAKVK